MALEVREECPGLWVQGSPCMLQNGASSSKGEVHDQTVAQEEGMFWAHGTWESSRADTQQGIWRIKIEILSYRKNGNFIEVPAPEPLQWQRESCWLRKVSVGGTDRGAQGSVLCVSTTSVWWDSAFSAPVIQRMHNMDNTGYTQVWHVTRGKEKKLPGNNTSLILD